MIAMNDFKSAFSLTGTAELAAVQRVLSSGWYILGQEVQAFEAAWATQCGTSFAVGVANGMDAIEIGLRSLEIGVGDEVITTSMTAFATVLAILRAGATPVLADIDPHTALLDPRSVERCITSRTKAILLVHLHGQLGNMAPWERLTNRTGVMLLEDCAQAHTAMRNGRRAGSFGIFGAYSFYPTKNLGAVGDAGALVTDNATIAGQARVLRNYGQANRYEHVAIGLNSRLDELQAALLCVRLKDLAECTDRRRAIASLYLERIHSRRVRPLTRPDIPSSHVYHLFVVLCEQRERLAIHLRERGIESLVHYPIAVHQQLACVGVRRDPLGLPSTERHAATCLSIPCHPQMSDHDAHAVATAVNEFR